MPPSDDSADMPLTPEEEKALAFELARRALPKGDIAFGFTPPDKWLVRIHSDGTAVFGEGYEPDEAARLFWDAVAQRHPNTLLRAPETLSPEERLKELLYQSMEGVLTRVGRADIYNEKAQRYAARPEATEHDRFMAEIAHHNLEAAVHETIELARGISQRDMTPDA